jgi:hypothetical protein
MKHTSFSQGVFKFRVWLEILPIRWISGMIRSSTYITGLQPNLTKMSFNSLNFTITISYFLFHIFKFLTLLPRQLHYSVLCKILLQVESIFKALQSYNYLCFCLFYMKSRLCPKKSEKYASHCIGNVTRNFIVTI